MRMLRPIVRLGKASFGQLFVLCAACSAAAPPAAAPEPEPEPILLQASEPPASPPSIPEEPEPPVAALEPEPPPEPPPPEPPPRHPFHEPVGANGAAPAMRIANLSPAACRKELAKSSLPTKRAGETKGIATALRLTGALGGVRFVAPGGKSPYGMLDCRLVLTLRELATVLERHHVAEVRVDNFYRPRSRLPGKRSKKSQHAYGLAMDVMGFRLEDGRSLVVGRDWHGGIGEPACGPLAAPSDPTEETVLLRNLLCDIVRSGVFHHVLTPGFDAAHRTHFHLDIKRNGYAIIVR